LTISESVGVSVSVRDLYESSTARSLGAKIEDTMKRQSSGLDLIRTKSVAPGRCLTWIKKAEVGRPILFMVHDVFGLATSYRSLIPHLDMSLAGFNDPYFGMENAGFETIEAMAAYYLDQMSPSEAGVTLMGWSFGGTVAAEMAIRLDDRGIPVHLILVDAPHIEGSIATHIDLDEFIQRQGHPESLAECFLQEVRKNARLIRAYSLPRPLSSRSRITSIKAMRHPEFTDRDLVEDDGVLFDERNGWGEKLGENWTTVPVQASHFQLFVEPFASEVAAAILQAEMC